jgi:hypothetical protein
VPHAPSPIMACCTHLNAYVHLQVASLAWALCQLTWYDEAALAAVHKRVGFIYRQLMPGQVRPALLMPA